MRFLADECCDFAVVRTLRAVGHDVSAVSEFQQRSVDQQLMELAHAEGRILLTEDKDFGWLAHVRRTDNPGVILIRFPATARRTLAASVARVVAELGSKLAGSFVVVRPGSVRISRVPDAGLRGDMD
jgi:predicted nuclease of predicted toxin-antitoxin system